MGKYRYGDVPDTIVTKLFISLKFNISTSFREVGHKYLNTVLDAISSQSYDFVVVRLNEAIMILRDLIAMKVAHPDKVLLYASFPTVITIQANLQQGFNKFLYLESASTAFFVINDISK